MASSNVYNEEVDSTDSNPHLDDCFTFEFDNANGGREVIEWYARTGDANPNNTETSYDVRGRNSASGHTWIFSNQTVETLEWQYQEGCQRLYSALTGRAPRLPKKSEFSIPERTADGRRSPSAGTMVAVWKTREGDGERPTECALVISHYEGIETLGKMTLDQVTACATQDDDVGEAAKALLEEREREA
ncbi:hypothetical protein L202_05138 [Cryptococcus amylolentus CBS 6039]|uniref:Uncharacterized protein n=2 Tax=Cryptococcus amylolentus TaxID=104669 RepID=A0A1E3HNY7_9TREE|nr:hypothetical protein L202_05138 [Cryptococcus amylolentus CBS 6039]ODN78058.1 hypothetical protein L202_05138 [Cryptococcus amylolentus CBS 6039]ODO06005.1 hypothetical protein I350_05066 [Cryptococcus amylolentus CBS 6273]